MACVTVKEPMCHVWFAFVGPPVVQALFAKHTDEQAPRFNSRNFPSELVVVPHGPVLDGAHVVLYPKRPRLLGDVV